MPPPPKIGFLQLLRLCDEIHDWCQLQGGLTMWEFFWWGIYISYLEHQKRAFNLALWWGLRYGSRGFYHVFCKHVPIEENTGPHPVTIQTQMSVRAKDLLACYMQGVKALGHAILSSCLLLKYFWSWSVNRETCSPWKWREALIL